MTNRLMMSVAAIALLAGTGLANAQATGGREPGGAATQQAAPSAAPAAPSTAPAAGGGATSGAMQNSAEPSSGMKSTQSDQKSPGATKSQRAEDNMPGQKSKGMSSENETKGQAKDMKAEGREGQGNMKAEGRQGHDKDMKAEGRDTNTRDNNMKAEGKSGNMNAETKGTERSQTTVGVAGGGAQLSTEQRTKITTVIREQRIAPVTNVNFSISIGTRVPREGVTFHTLPASVVTIYPEWRGYDYILVRDQILVIDPRSHEIVAIIDA